MSLENKLKKLSHDLYKMKNITHAKRIQKLADAMRDDRIVKEATTQLATQRTWTDVGKNILRRILNFVPGIQRTSLSRISDKDHKAIANKIRAAITTATDDPKFPSNIKDTLLDIADNYNDNQIILFAAQNGLITGYEDPTSEGSYRLHTGTGRNTGAAAPFYEISESLFGRTDAPMPEELARVGPQGEVSQSGRVHPTHDIMDMIGYGFTPEGDNTRKLIDAGRRLIGESEVNLYQQYEGMLDGLPEDIKSPMQVLSRLMREQTSVPTYYIREWGQRLPLYMAAVYYATQNPEFFRALIGKYSENKSFQAASMAKNLKDELDKFNEDPEAALRTVLELSNLSNKDVKNLPPSSRRNLEEAELLGSDLLRQEISEATQRGELARIHRRLQERSKN